MHSIFARRRIQNKKKTMLQLITAIIAYKIFSNIFNMPPN